MDMKQVFKVVTLRTKAREKRTKAMQFSLVKTLWSHMKTLNIAV